jgi:hypothetical protein
MGNWLVCSSLSIHVIGGDPCCQAILVHGHAIDDSITIFALVQNCVAGRREEHLLKAESQCRCQRQTQHKVLFQFLGSMKRAVAFLPPLPDRLSSNDTSSA